MCLSDLFFDDCGVVQENIFSEKFFRKMEALGVDGIFIGDGMNKFSALINFS
jgi:hypothetical protein